jgi:hypothetical protein
VRVEAYPKRGDVVDVEELWNGPEALFRAAGFELERTGIDRCVFARTL